MLVALSGAWWLLLVGAACVAAAWFYTGGPRPYGYLGLGEVFVFVFFGLVAVLGTTYAQAGRVDAAAVAAAVAIGALACAILVANNLRDIPTDALAGKRTLAVRLGDARHPPVLRRRSSRCRSCSCRSPPRRTRGRGWRSARWRSPCRPVRAVLRGDKGLELLPVLRDTGRLELGYAVLLALGLAL